MKDRIASDIKRSYRMNGYDFDKAMEVWVDNDVSTSDIRYAIKSDCGYDVSTEFVEYLVRKAFLKHPDCNRCFIDADLIDKIDNSRFIKLTPQVRRHMISCGNNTFKTRYSSSSVEWSIVFIDNIPHLARKDFRESEVKYSNKEENERDSN